MAHLFDKIAEASEKARLFAEKGYEHTRAEVIGTLHPNRRHDEPEEKEHDAILASIRAGHRFDSFANVRDGNFVKWHIDGHDYMWALSEMLENAKEAIFILDWWLTPELYLRRPPAYHSEWRLDKVLKRKAEQGVKIHVIVYKEVSATMSMNSKHTKAALEALHPNIAVMRHPDHIGTKDRVEFWSHHEKVVVVDNHFACIGGLDLCFGRWDTHNHPLADVHPTDFSRTLFPGQDYNNARVLDFQNVPDWASNAIPIMESARMPWHDVHMTISGPSVLDIAQHFIERWNEVRKRKYKTDTRFPIISFPQADVQSAPNEAIHRHPHLHRFHELGQRYKQYFFQDEPQEEDTYHPIPNPATCRVQVVRSVSDWSHGVLTEHSIQDAYCQMIREANHYVYIENQFFISATKEGGVVVNLIAKALVERVVEAAQKDQRFKVVIVIPELPGFAGDVKSESSLKIIMAAQYRTMNRGGSSIYEEIRKAGYEPTDYIRFYHLRAFDRINAPYPSFIKQMEDKSGVSFNKARVALARRWVGDLDDSGKNMPKTVTLKEVTPTTEGIVVSDKTTTKDESVPMPATEEEARSIIRQFEDGAKQLREDVQVSDSVAQHMLYDKTTLLEEKWLGSEGEELNAYVSELLYIHTKLMIVDDLRVIMGSANINDRSQKGDGDSEIALVVEDTDLIHTTMNGKPFMASRFAASLRRKLYREHLGLIAPQFCEDPNHEVTSFMRPAPFPNDDETGLAEDASVADPLSDDCLALWNDTARKNREIFTEIFQPVPTNLARDWRGYESYVPKIKTGHTAPGVKLTRVKERLAQVKGAVVDCPIDFLIDEKDFVEGPMWRGLDPMLPIYL